MIEFIERYTGAAGLLPEFFSADDPREPKAQLHEAYAHGGGFSDMSSMGWERVALDFGMPEASRLKYPEDPALRPIAYAWLRDWLLVLFEGAWLVMQQQGESPQTRPAPLVCRVD